MLTAGMSPAVSAQALETTRRREGAALDGSVFDLRSKLLPDAVSLIGAFGFLTERERRLVWHIQGFTYVNLFAALKRAVADEFDAWRTGDAIDSPSEINISARARRRTFQRMDRLLARSMPAGYRSVVDLDSMTRGALGRCRAWYRRRAFQTGSFRGLRRLRHEAVADVPQRIPARTGRGHHAGDDR